MGWDSSAVFTVECLIAQMYRHLRGTGVGGTAVPVTGEKGLGWRL